MWFECTLASKFVCLYMAVRMMKACVATPWRQRNLRVIQRSICATCDQCALDMSTTVSRPEPFVGVFVGNQLRSWLVMIMTYCQMLQIEISKFQIWTKDVFTSLCLFIVIITTKSIICNLYQKAIMAGGDISTLNGKHKNQMYNVSGYSVEYLQVLCTRMLGLVWPWLCSFEEAGRFQSSSSPPVHV